MTSRSGASGGVRFTSHPRKDLKPIPQVLPGLKSWDDMSEASKARWESSAREQLERNKKRI